MRDKHVRTWNMVGKTQKDGKRSLHTVGPGVWRETLKKYEKLENHTV